MNNITIIGNLTADPQLRTTSNGNNVCTFNVAVNRRNRDGADYFRVNAWGNLGENCNRYLERGKKVAVCGEVSLNEYTSKNGEKRASIEINASGVDFLSPSTKNANKAPSEANTDTSDGYVEVTDDELPF